MLGVHIEGDLCPVCRFRLKDEFGGTLRGRAGRHARLLEAQPRRHRRRAAGRPEQPGHLGADRQRGHLASSTVYSRGRPARARSERRAQRRQPRHGRVHRGLQERDRVPPRHDHGDAGEGRSRRPAGTAWSTSTPCIVAHSNEAEWQKFKADHTNEAILDRIVVVKVPYNLRLSEEVKIYQKIIRHSDFRAHVAPHTLEMASMFAILSRLEPTAEVRPDDQAQALQRRGGRREGQDRRSSTCRSCATTPSARA